MLGLPAFCISLAALHCNNSLTHSIIDLLLCNEAGLLSFYICFQAVKPCEQRWAAKQKHVALLACIVLIN